MHKKTFTPARLCRIAMLAALYVLLNMISIRAGNLRITFASLPVVVGGLIFGPLEGALIALGGEFLNQLLTYGPSPTMPLWLLAPMVRGVLVGLAAERYRRAGRPLESRPLACYGVCIGAALGTTAVNTAALAADGLLLGYYTPALVVADLGWRIVSGTIIAVVIATTAMPLAVLLRRMSADRRA